MGFEPSVNRKFNPIKIHVKNTTNSLKNMNEKMFRDECLKLADYLIENKSPPEYVSSRMWESTLKFRLKQYFEGLTKHGGCFMILENDDKERLKLKYEEEDFCKKKTKDIQEIELLKQKNSNRCENKCFTKCKVYNNWIKEMEKSFETRKSLFENCYKKEIPKKKRNKQIPEQLCDILDHDTFKELPDCLSVNLDESTQHLLEQENKSLQTQTQEADYMLPKFQDQQEADEPIIIKPQIEHEQHISVQVPSKLPEIEDSILQSATKEATDIISSGFTPLETSKSHDNAEVSADNNALPHPVNQDTQVSSDGKNTPSTPEVSTNTLAYGPPEIPHTTDITNDTYIYTFEITILKNIYIHIYIIHL
ncbi:hypothetical protein MKS88_004037 [Plasmodium brasilianum]|uniref:Uncharacterized protein n=1 Tax=Plasmodium brasilianum TaxID=5824 RepID=A0ACB9Y6D6_PLABR|nr:hypothetical protein MKS88_004037 [Plasmodium brasilianum]